MKKYQRNKKEVIATIGKNVLLNEEILKAAIELYFKGFRNINIISTNTIAVEYATASPATKITLGKA